MLRIKDRGPLVLGMSGAGMPPFDRGVGNCAALQLQQQNLRYELLS
jgi:hypothetical protein